MSNPRLPVYNPDLQTHTRRRIPPDYIPDEHRQIALRVLRITLRELEAKRDRLRAEIAALDARLSELPEST